MGGLKRTQFYFHKLEKKARKITNKDVQEMATRIKNGEDSIKIIVEYLYSKKIHDNLFGFLWYLCTKKSEKPLLKLVINNTDPKVQPSAPDTHIVKNSLSLVEPKESQ